MGARPRRPGLRGAVVALLAVAALAGCSPGAAAPSDASDPAASSDRTDPSAVPTVTEAREARPGAGATARFVPTSIELPGDVSAPVVPVATAGTGLVVPAEVDQVGWWDGSAYVGDPFGAIVLAGHVDSTDQGLGFFHRLWSLGEGQTVVLGDGPHRQPYRIAVVRRVDRSDLVRDDEALSQTGPARLVLITCVGEFRPERGGYQQNLVVVAEPVG